MAEASSSFVGVGDGSGSAPFLSATAAASEDRRRARKGKRRRRIRSIPTESGHFVAGRRSESDGESGSDSVTAKAADPGSCSPLLAAALEDRGGGVKSGCEGRRRAREGRGDGGREVTAKAEAMRDRERKEATASE